MCFNFSVLCLIALAINMINLHENESFSARRKRQFYALSALIAIQIIINTIFISDDNNFTTIIKIIEYFLITFIFLLFSKIITRKDFWRKSLKICFMLLTALQVLFTVLILLDKIKYQYIYIYSFIIGEFILLIISSIKTFIQNKNKISLTLIVNDIFLITGFAINTICNTTSGCIAIVLAYFVFLVYFSDGYLKIDHMTSLLNKRTFKNRIDTINYTTVFIVIDANNFKAINDNYGHPVGDEALRKIGESIFNVYGNVAYCFRTGGDEFTVILRPGMLEELTKQNKSVCSVLQNLMDNLDKQIALISKKDCKVLIDGVSQGYAIYRTLADCTRDDITYKTPIEVLNIADQWMYEMKGRKSPKTKK